MIFQQYALFPWLTVRGNVEFGLKLASVAAAERRLRAERAIELVGLGDFADALPRTLSGGMKQRCAIARAYAVDPQVLLMDEPFGALDALTRVQMQDQLLETWSRDRRTVMFITHDVDEAVYLARRVVVMAAKPGRIHSVVPVDLPYPRTEAMRLSPRSPGSAMPCGPPSTTRPRPLRPPEAPTRSPAPPNSPKEPASCVYLSVP